MREDQSNQLNQQQQNQQGQAKKFFGKLPSDTPQTQKQQGRGGTVGAVPKTEEKEEPPQQIQAKKILGMLSPAQQKPQTTGMSMKQPSQLATQGQPIAQEKEKPKRKE